MDRSAIRNYLDRARETIGERTKSQIDYDDAVVASLRAGQDIRKAIDAANRKVPEEALTPGPEHWSDLNDRYQYIREHKKILKRLGIRE